MQRDEPREKMASFRDPLGSSRMEVLSKYRSAEA